MLQRTKMPKWMCMNKKDMLKHDSESVFIATPSVVQGCGQTIEGSVLRALGKCYHPHHFTCAACGIQLQQFVARCVQASLRSLSFTTTSHSKYGTLMPLSKAGLLKFANVRTQWFKLISYPTCMACYQQYFRDQRLQTHFCRDKHYSTNTLHSSPCSWRFLGELLCLLFGNWAELAHPCRFMFCAMSKQELCHKLANEQRCRQCLNRHSPYNILPSWRLETNTALSECFCVCFRNGKVYCKADNERLFAEKCKVTIHLLVTSDSVFFTITTSSMLQQATLGWAYCSTWMQRVSKITNLEGFSM